MQSYSLGLYEKAMPAGMAFAEMLALAAESGFDRLEISVDESEGRLARLEWGNAERRKVKHAISDTGVPISTMCLSGHRKFPMGSHDEELRRRSMDIMRGAVELSADIGVKIIQLAGYDVYYEQGDGDTRKWFAQNLAEAVEYAARLGVVLAFETMETPFMDTVGKAMDYVGQINSPWLGVYPDIGNLKNASVLYGSDLLADIELGRGHIFAAHLKETRPGVYRDMWFGEGHTDYGCIALLWEMGVRMYTGEFWYSGGDCADRLRRAAIFLRQRIEGR